MIAERFGSMSQGSPTGAFSFALAGAQSTNYQHSFVVPNLPQETAL
jgi:hypothetical protein